MFPRLVFFQIACLLVLAILTPAVAPAEVHRVLDTETGWYWLHDVSAETISDFIDDNNARIIDLEIHTVSPLRFTVAFVVNQGVYASAWWWYYDHTLEEVDQRITANDARLIDIERYMTADGERWAVVMIPNTGAQQKVWWYYTGVRAPFISTALDANNARLVDIESYDTSAGRRYAVIMISNTGQDAIPWGWYYNIDLATLTSYMNENNMRLLEFQVRDPGVPTFDAIMVPLEHHAPRTWWWLHDVTSQQLPTLINQAGSRITDIDTYLVGGERRYSAVLLNNSNNVTIAAASALQWGSDGWTGAYLKEVDGPILAALQPDFVFEPASTIKAIHHLHAMRSVMQGESSLWQQVHISMNYDDLGCPLGGPPIFAASLSYILEMMMVDSNNPATEGITELYGQQAIQNTAQQIAGMTSTELNHPLGCAEAAFNPNRLTLADIGRLYERVQSLTILDEPNRDTFYSLMLNQDTLGGFTSILRNTIYETVSDLGLPTSLAHQYWGATLTAWKRGGYTIGSLTYTSVGGVVSLPRCAFGSFDDWRHYVFGLFVEGAAGGDGLTRIQAAFPILFRDLIEADLLACVTSVDELPVAQTRLSPPSPNPFNPGTELAFSLDRARAVRLSVHDAAGREVAVMVDGHLESGRHTAYWNGRDQRGRPMAAGIYIARLVAGDLVQSQKMALIK